MELPFAVESSPNPVPRSSLDQSDSSLVTASSQGSFMNSSGLDTPLPPNTPHDVVLPHYDNLQNQAPHAQQQIIPGHLVTPAHRVVEQDDIYGEPEIIDFTYVNVSETDADEVDILLEGGGVDLQQEPQRGDVLTVLLSGMQQNSNESLLSQTESANLAAMQASDAKKNGDLVAALEYHTQSAKLYRDNAMAVRERNASLANSMLLLSQTQAKSALALKAIVKLDPAELRRILPSSSDGETDSTSTAAMSQKDRLRAAVRGALGSRHPHEEDISDSQFLGRATSGPTSTAALETGDDSRNDDEGGMLLSEGQESNHNPVDEMMELERELRDMDMALELGNSISSLDARMQNRMKNSVIDGSFMVVPPGSNSYMSSSMWGSGHIPSNSRPVPPQPNPNNSRPAPQPNNIRTAGVRARANRVQNMLEASTAPVNRQPNPPQSIAPTLGTKNSAGLESSWWGNASSTSQILTNSVISLGSRAGSDGGHMSDGNGNQHANTKQLMRLMDSLKTLGDENAALLREVEEAEAARLEAKQAREQMKRFKGEYGKRFSSLKKALEKFRQEHPQEEAATNPVNTSEFIRTASVTDQLQRQEQLIRKLTADLKKEKEESKKKDAALRKYESFYREVKARSAQKAAMKTQQQRQHKVPRQASSSSSRVHR